jgi:hypothetical protein
MVPPGRRFIFDDAKAVLDGMTAPNIIDGRKNPMKMLAFLLAVVCVVVGVMYYVLPGGSLPTFMPGYAADSTRIHMLHGFAAVTSAVVFLLIGLSTTPYHQQPRSPHSV